MESHFGQKRSSFSRTVENFLGRSRIFSDGRDFSRTVENFLGRSRIFLGRSRIFSDGRDFKFFSVGRDFPSNSPAFPSV